MTLGSPKPLLEEVKKEAAKKREEALNAILREEQLELEKFEKDLAAAKKLSLGEEVDASDPPASGARYRAEAECLPAASTRRRSKSAANKSGVGPEPTLSWGEIFAKL